MNSSKSVTGRTIDHQHLLDKFWENSRKIVADVEVTNADVENMTDSQYRRVFGIPYKGDANTPAFDDSKMLPHQKIALPKFMNGFVDRGIGKGDLSRFAAVDTVFGSTMMNMQAQLMSKPVTVPLDPRLAPLSRLCRAVRQAFGIKPVPEQNPTIEWLRSLPKWLRFSMLYGNYNPGVSKRKYMKC
jgi:hypothetical protein